MSRPDNPRFPHTCVITRYVETEPLEDQQNVSTSPLVDEDEEQGDGEESTTDSSVVYEGECRVYERLATSDKGEAITSYRGLALPLTRKDWQELGVVPQAGDIVVVDRGGYTEYGTVIDKNPGNFGGTHVIWRYDRN